MIIEKNKNKHNPKTSDNKHKIEEFGFLNLCL